MNNIICFLTVHPNELFYNFVKQLPKEIEMVLKEMNTIIKLI